MTSPKKLREARIKRLAADEEVSGVRTLPQSDDPAKHKDHYEKAVKHFLTWMAKPMRDGLDKMLTMVEKEAYKSGDRRIIMKGITESIKMYGFKAFEGHLAPTGTWLKAPEKAASVLRAERLRRLRSDRLG